MHACIHSHTHTCTTHMHTYIHTHRITLTHVPNTMSCIHTYIHSHTLTCTTHTPILVYTYLFVNIAFGIDKNYCAHKKRMKRRGSTWGRSRLLYTIPLDIILYETAIYNIMGGLKLINVCHYSTY